MENKQFELLMGEIKEIKTSIAQLDNRVSRLEKEQELSSISINKEFIKLGKKIDDQAAISARHASTVMRLVEERFQEIKNEMEGMHEDIRTLHVLAKINQEQHEEYDRILNIKRA